MATFVERWVFQTNVLVCMTFLPKIPLQISFSKNWTRKETTIQRQVTFAQKKISLHSSVSIGCADWLLLFIRSDATTAAWIDGKAVIPNSSHLSHGISKIPSSRWKSRRRAKSSCLKRLEQITKLRRLSLCTFRFHKIYPSLCTFLLFRTIISPQNGMAWSAVPPVRLLCCYIPLQRTWLTFFLNYFLSLSPQKQVNMRIYRITMFWIWRHIRSLTHAPLKSIVNQNGGLLTYFDEPQKIKDLTKSKNFCGKLFH